MGKTQYQWKQPVGGKSIIWRPLTGGDLMDLDTNYSRADVAPMRAYAQYAMRIVSCEGLASQFQPHDFRSWDEIDIQAFMLEVDAKDAMRMAAVNGDSSVDAVKRLERAMGELAAAAKKVAAEAQITLAAARALEAKSGPLKVSASPEGSQP